MLVAPVVIVIPSLILRSIRPSDFMLTREEDLPVPRHIGSDEFLTEALIAWMKNQSRTKLSSLEVPSFR